MGTAPKKRADAQDVFFSMVDVAFRAVRDTGVKKKKEGLVMSGRRREVL